MRKHRNLSLILSGVLALVFPLCAGADCYDDAARYQGLNAGVFRAIAIRENSTCANVKRVNKDGSTDTGCMQINSVHYGELSRFGISPNDLLDKCKNVYVAAWHYRTMIQKYGDTWQAVGAYKSKTPEIRDQYAREVYEIWLRYDLNQIQ
jgi:hypothetical protein